MLVLPVSVPGSEMIGVFLGFYSRFSLHASRLLNFLSTVSLVSVLNSVIGPYPWTRPKNWDVQPGGHGQTEQRQGRVNTGEMQIQDGLLGHQLNASGHKSSLRVVVQGLMCICGLSADVACLGLALGHVDASFSAGATCFLASIFSTPIDDSLYFSELGGGTGRYGSSGWFAFSPTTPRLYRRK